MFPHLGERRSDSRFVERVWRTASEREGAFTSISTVHWSIVVATLDGRVSVSLHGPETVATRKEHPPEMPWFGIVLAMGTYLPALPLDTVFAACYSDQSHLTRSLKRFIGRTPTEIAASPIVALHAST